MTRRQRPARSARAQRLREAKTVHRTRFGTAIGALSIVAGLLGALLTIGSIGAVMKEYGVIAFRSPMTGELSPFLLTYIAAGCVALGGIGLLTLQTWGWWLAVAGATFGLTDLGRLYVGLFASINPDHPRAGELTGELLLIVSIPGSMFVAIIAMLMQRSIRVAYHVSRDDGSPLVLDDGPLEDDGD